MLPSSYFMVAWRKPSGVSGKGGPYRTLSQAEAVAKAERVAGREATIVCWRCGDTKEWCPNWGD